VPAPDRSGALVAGGAVFEVLRGLAGIKRPGFGRCGASPRSGAGTAGVRGWSPCLTVWARNSLCESLSPTWIISRFALRSGLRGGMVDLLIRGSARRVGWVMARQPACVRCSGCVARNQGGLDPPPCQRLTGLALWLRVARCCGVLRVWRDKAPGVRALRRQPAGQVRARLVHVAGAFV